MRIALFLVLAFTKGSQAAEYVQGYTRSDGTWVNGYFRNDANGTVRDNYTYRGNQNPYTGQTGTNYYRNSPSSEYYVPRTTLQPASPWQAYPAQQNGSQRNSR